MSERATVRMRLAEFLCWDDGTDTRYELIDGVAVAMAPPAEAHRILAVRLVSRIDAALAGKRPCNAQIEAGILRADRADSYFAADIAATCRLNERDRQAIAEPILIVDILSPGSDRHDRHTRVPAFREIASVEEILRVDSQAPYAEILRRSGKEWITELVQGLGATLALASVDLRVAMAELYDGIDVAATS